MALARTCGFPLNISQDAIPIPQGTQGSTTAPNQPNEPELERHPSRRRDLITPDRMQREAFLFAQGILRRFCNRPRDPGQNPAGRRTIYGRIFLYWTAAILRPWAPTVQSPLETGPSRRVYLLAPFLRDRPNWSEFALA